jgi:hypothetical protein
VNNSWWVNDAVKKVVLSPAIGEAAAKLLRTNEIRLWHDQVIAKPGLGPDGHNEKAGNIGWHQVRRSAPAPSLPTPSPSHTDVHAGLWVLASLQQLVDDHRLDRAAGYRPVQWYHDLLLLLYNYIYIIY